MIGQALSHYRVEEQIGAGGMGVVYRARDLRLERDVALKVLPERALADEPARRRFRREALALSRLNHPAVEAVFDFDTDRGVDFLVMELIPGESLERRLAAGPLAEREVVQLAIQIAEGLEAAHEQGVVHRDLKPANVVVTPKGRVKLLDFGIAKLLAHDGRESRQTTLTEVSDLVGTPRYMAPEALLGRPVDARTDLYALGVVLYELCAGRPPFDSPITTALIGEILHTEPPRVDALKPGLSPGLVALIHRCLEKDPERRYASARELLEDLRALESGAAPRVAQPAGSPAAKRRSRSLANTLVLSVVLIVALTMAILGRGRIFRRAVHGGPIQSIAVLPLDNLSNDPEQEYFVDGMTDGLITEMAQVASLRVISRTSVMAFKGSSKPLPEIAKALKVDAVVEGSVQRQGDRVLVTAQLIRAADDRNLWARSYQRDPRDLINLQAELTAAITAEVRAVLRPAERARLSRSRSVNPAAHDAYLRGRYQLIRRTRMSLETAAREFQQAIALDSTFAPAYAGLASVYLVLPQYSTIPTEESYARARIAATRAAQLDDGLAEAHAVLAGLMHESDWRHADAEREYRRALEAGPSDATLHQWYGEFLETEGRFPEAFAEYARAHDLDPLSLIIPSVTGCAYWHDRQYAESIRRLRAVIATDSTFGRAHYHLASALVLSGDVEQGILEREKADVLMSGRDPAEAHRSAETLLKAYRAGGRVGYWRKVLELRLARLEKGEVRPLGVAVAYAQLGMRDQAFEYLNRALLERDPDCLWLKVNPYVDPIRGDPRFTRLLDRLGLLRGVPGDG